MGFVCQVKEGLDCVCVVCVCVCVSANGLRMRSFIEDLLLVNLPVAR
jgi:hypothetical protein